MVKRPTSITVIAWIFIVMSPISIITTLVTMNNPMVKEMMSQSMLPIPVQYFMSFVGMLISLICAIAMLKRQNWARHLYVYFSILGFIVSLITSPFRTALIPGIILFMVVAFFLFRPKANEYFRANLTESI